MEVKSIKGNKIMIEHDGKLLEIVVDENGVEVWQAWKGCLIFLGKLCYKE